MRLLPLLVLAVLLAGCGSGEDATTAAAEAPTGVATGEASESPFGEYEREVTEDEIVATPGQEAPPAGTWHLTLGETVIQVVDPTGFRFSQELSVSGDTLEIERYLGGDGVFCEEDGPSSYHWHRDGDELTLAKKDDACRDRELILAAVWTRTG